MPFTSLKCFHLPVLLSLAVCAGSATAQSNCTSGPPATAALGAAELTDQLIDPCAISSDPGNCDNPGGQSHLVIWNDVLMGSGDLEDELVVFLPGNGQTPTNLEWVARAAGFAGYRTVSLAYEGDTLPSACGTETGNAFSTCVRKFRRDVLLGDPTPTAGVTDIHRANSVEQRLLDLLADLDASNPGDGWDAYFNGSDLEFGNIVIGGYSLGSGHASFWARIERFAGVTTLSGPTDYVCEDFPHDRTLHPGLFYPLGCTNTLAGWIRDETHDTPGADRYAAFHGEEAHYYKLDGLIRVWDHFGIPRLPGPHLTIDVTGAFDFVAGSPWPLAGPEHRFSFGTPLPTGCTGHEAAAVDSCLELDAASNLPLAFPLYMHLFCAAGGDLP